MHGPGSRISAKACFFVLKATCAAAQLPAGSLEQCSLCEMHKSPLLSGLTVMQARKNLELVRGTKDVDKEFNDMVSAAHLAMAVKHPWKVRSGSPYSPA